jgi:voltage-gated potassium channel
MLGAECDTVFILKCLLKQSPFKYVFAGFVMGICVCGWILMIAESPLDRIHSNYKPHTFINSCWASICTMTTVGYGDIFPRTILGRFTALSCAVYGTAIVSLMLVSFTNFLQMDSPQGMAFTIIKRLKIRDLIKENAGRLLITINRKSDRNNIDLEFARYSEIKRLITTFRG